MKKIIFIFGLMIQIGCATLPPVTVDVGGIPIVVNPTVTPTLASTITPLPIVNPTEIPVPTKVSDGIPVPSGTPPWKSACKLPESPNLDPCKNPPDWGKGDYFQAVVKCRADVQSKYPELFTYAGKTGCEWMVNGTSNQDSYYWAMTLCVNSLGYCTEFDGENVDVKLDNTHDEQYHVLISNGCVNGQSALHAWTCTPASF